MSTVIRPEISDKNKYWIPKHRYYELKHFCLQYPDWKKELCETRFINSKSIIRISKFSQGEDSVYKAVERSLYLKDQIDLVDTCAKDTDEYLGQYILKAVTEDRSYNYLKTRLEIPCSKGTYYDRYRRFFYILDKRR